jgi:hypothetical protein
LASITEDIGKERKESERISPPDDNAQSECGSIHEIPEEFNVSQVEQEQMYTTAPGSLGPSSDPEAFKSISGVLMDKGKGCVRNTPSLDEGTSSSWSERGNIPTKSYADEEWAQLKSALDHWGALAEQSKVDSIQYKQEVGILQTRIINSYHRTSNIMDAMQGIQQMVDRIHVRSDDHALSRQGITQIKSPHALASQALYADRSSNTGTMEFEQHQHAQARFTSTQTSDLVKVEKTESDNITPLSYNRMEGEEARAEHRQKANNWERYALQMAMSCGQVKYIRPQHARTSGPPPQTQTTGGGLSRDPLDSSSEDDEGEPLSPPEGLQITWPPNDQILAPNIIH